MATAHSQPQGATVSVLFQLIVAYPLGRAMSWLPRHGWWRYINPGPFNSESSVRHS